MPFTFSVLPVITRVRAAVKASFTAQGEAPLELPLTTTARQVAEAGGDFPLTLIQWDEVDASEDDCPVNSVRLAAAITIHHLRMPEPGTGSGAETAILRMSGLAAFMRQDYRLESVAAAGDTFSIERVIVGKLLGGEKNPVQQMLDMNNQEQLVVSLALTVIWQEDLS